MTLTDLEILVLQKIPAIKYDTEYSDDVITKNFVCFKRFEYHLSMEHDEKNPHTKFGGNWFMGPKIWLHEYLISPTEISVNWSGSLQL